MNKENERNRIAGIVFNGAPMWVDYAQMADSGMWYWFRMDGISVMSDICHNQPSTSLEPSESFLVRADYGV